MNIGNITSNNFNLDFNGKEMQIEVYEKLIKQLQQENQQLKDNWNKLKEYMIKEQARIVIENTDEDEFVYTNLLNKMKEIEQGSDSKDDK